MAGDAKYWIGVLWIENLRPDWKLKIGDILELPYAYCIHDKDLDKEEDRRKPHVHLIVCWPNTTTYNNALRTFNELSAQGKQAINKVERIKSIRHAYEYLIHNTETAKKENKFQYGTADRIEGNNFDIGIYEQVSLEDKQRMKRELAKLIMDNDIRYYHIFYKAVCSGFDSVYEEVASSYVGFFSALCRSFHSKRSDEIKAAENKNEEG